MYSLGGGSHLYSGSQTVDYKANLTHNSSVLVCKVSIIRSLGSFSLSQDRPGLTCNNPRLHLTK